jgi:hypothetical protein
MNQVYEAAINPPHPHYTSTVLLVNHDECLPSRRPSAGHSIPSCLTWTVSVLPTFLSVSGHPSPDRLQLNFIHVTWMVGVILRLLTGIGFSISSFKFSTAISKSRWLSSKSTVILFLSR